MSEKYYLRLYISAGSDISQIALRNLEAICKEYIDGKYELEVIDVFQNPELVEEDKVMIIPTLIKKRPQPVRKIVGDLQDKEKVLFVLDLIQKR